MAKSESNKDDDNLSSDVLYKIEVSANRYDLLCLEGLALALRIYLGIEKPIKFKISKPSEVQKFIVDESVRKVRHFACSAALKGVTFTEESLKSFIELQDKLHQNVCRQRTLVTMGTHDMDTVKFPAYYTAEKPEDIVFKALKQEKEMNARELVDNLRKKDDKLKKYLHLLDGLETFPVIRDSTGTVLSMPPIINSEYSKITVNTKNIFIDITAVDETKANIVLNTLVTMFSCYCDEIYTIEPIEVIYSDKTTVTYPLLEYNEFTTNTEYLNRISGANDLSRDKIIELLDKMSLDCSKGNGENEIKVIVPPTRTDIIHACDIAEDLAIAFGYDNIKKIKPGTICNGYQQPISKLTELFRQELAMCGYTETLTFALVSKEDAIVKMGKKLEDELKNFVQIFKSKTQEFEIVRTSLIPGIIKTIEKNQMSGLPLKLFEISDVVLIDEATETGAVNRRSLCVGYANNSSGFEIVQGVIDHLLQNKLGLSFINHENDHSQGYTIVPSKDHRFFDDRQATIKVLGQEIGIIGVLHPEINKQFGKLPFPIVISEIDIEFVYDLIKNKKV